MRGGGRLVLGLDGDYGPLWTEEIERAPPMPPTSPIPPAATAPLAKVFPLWPGVRGLRAPGRRVLRGPGLLGAQAVFLAGDDPVVARLPVGRGEVVLLACPEVLQNSRLAAGDHLAFLAALAGPERGGGGSRPVYFDERTHGASADAGLLVLLGRWGLGPALLLGGLAALAAALRRGVRLGPPEREPPDARSDAVDLVDALGELYDRALPRSAALRLYWESFVRTLGIESGLTGEPLAARARELAAGFVPPAAEEDLSREGFERALATLNRAHRRLADGRHRS